MLDGFSENMKYFEYAIPINEGGKRVMLISGIGAKGRFEMKMGEDCVLWCKTLKGEWRSIDEYRFVGNEESEESNDGCNQKRAMDIDEYRGQNSPFNLFRGR